MVRRDFAWTRPQLSFSENDTGVIEHYEATDPDNTLHWDVKGPNAPFFTIADGRLQFVDAPNFEAPGDLAVAGGDPDNIYEVTLRAVEVRAGGYDGPAQSEELTVTVTVTNVAENGEVSINWLQPEVATPIMAELGDPDGGTGEQWQWYRSKVDDPDSDPASATDRNLHWEAATGGGNNLETYTPNADDVGKYLLAEASYSVQVADETVEKMHYARSVHVVRADVSDTDNNSPDFAPGAGQAETDREIAEDVSIGSPVGARVAVPDNTLEVGEVLTYTLDDAPATTPNRAEGDAGFFAIDPATGRLTVAKRLDYDNNPETPEDAAPAPDGIYVIQVTATDPSNAANDGDSDTIIVTITALDRNDAPKVSGERELAIDEDMDLGEGVDNDTNLYMWMDEDSVDSPRWTLEGPDHAVFELAAEVEGESIEETRRLFFKRDMKPDYEEPADQDGDNVYEVTIRVTDNDGLSGTQRVRVTVNNIVEEGEIELTPAQPRLGEALTAALSDPDVVESETDWAWYRTATEAEPEFENVAAISGATTGMYVPELDDVGMFLHARVEYRDGASVEDDPVTTPGTDTTNDERNNGGPDSETDTFDSDVMLTMSTTKAVVATPAVNTAPEFSAGPIGREVSENTPGTAYVDYPVVAANEDLGDVITYTLGGPHERFFELLDEKSGQLMVSVGTGLEFEGTQASYNVDLTAEDHRGLTDTVRVNIQVTNVNEAPSEPHEFFQDPGVLVRGDANVSYVENGTDAVDTYSATGMLAGSTVRWTVSGDDGSDFAISSGGELTFDNPPDFEAPADMDGGNTYEVTVMVEAVGGDQSSMLEVTVRVTNVDEDGSVAAITGTARVGSTLTAGMVSDPDGNVRDERWTWERSTDGMTGWSAIGGATASTYEATAADVDDYLRVKVTYTDGEGFGKDVTSARTSKVVAADAGDPLLRDYDPNGDGTIERADMRRAVADFFGPSPTLTRAEMRQLVGIYFG